MRAQKGKLLGFNSHIIYRVYIEEQNKVIRVKDLQILQDMIVKVYSSLPDFDKKLTFDTV